MAIKLYNKRMLAVLDYLKETKGISLMDSCARIGYRSTNLKFIREGKVSFTLEQLDKAIKEFKINPAYFFKVDATMYAENKIKTSIAPDLQQLETVISNLQKKMK